MKIEEVKAGQPIRVGEITLVPIERTFVSYVGMAGGAVVRGVEGALRGLWSSQARTGTP